MTDYDAPEKPDLRGTRWKEVYSKDDLADAIRELRAERDVAVKRGDRLLRSLTETHQLDCVCVYCEEERSPIAAAGEKL